MKRLIKWFLTVVLFRKAVLLLRIIFNRLGLKGIVIAMVLFFILSSILKHCV